MVTVGKQMNKPIIAHSYPFVCVMRTLRSILSSNFNNKIQLNKKIFSRKKETAQGKEICRVKFIMSPSALNTVAIPL